MAFQPFGYNFEITSSLTPTDARAAIRSKKTNILDAKNGARGWIVGPFICLWFSAFDRYGPMLFGLISADNSGTRVHGKAGSDLNGILLFTLLIPIMAWLVFMMIAEGQESGGLLVIIALVFLVGGPLVYWSAHKQRKDADPLVRFLCRAISKPTSKRASTAKEGLRLILNGDRFEEPVTQEAIQSAFLRVGSRDFLIIESDEQNYLQVACQDGEYVLEIRKGGQSEHYQAVRVASNELTQADNTLTYEEVSEALASYVSGQKLPKSLRLQPLKLIR